MSLKLLYLTIYFLCHHEHTTIRSSCLCHDSRREWSEDPRKGKELCTKAPHGTDTRIEIYTTFSKPMENSFPTTSEFPPEPIDNIPSAVVNFAQFMRYYADKNCLTHVQQIWFMNQIAAHMPMYLMCLWQGFPEWDVCRTGLKELDLALQVEDSLSSQRYCAILLNQKKVVETRI